MNIRKALKRVLAKEGQSKILKALDSIYQDKLPGGIGDKAKPSDFDLVQVLKGIVVELEHTSNEAVALEIVVDHLSEKGNERYYDKLETIEG